MVEIAAAVENDLADTCIECALGEMCIRDSSEALDDYKKMQSATMSTMPNTSVATSGAVMAASFICTRLPPA